MSIIVRHYTVRKYFMLNAAVPSEAFDESNISTDSKNRMHNKHWNDYNEKTWCTKWYSYFPLNDDRRKLTWINRFQNNISCTYINYFSLGDEILKLLPTNDAHFGTGVGSGLNFSYFGVTIALIAGINRIYSKAGDITIRLMAQVPTGAGGDSPWKTEPSMARPEGYENTRQPRPTNCLCQPCKRILYSTCILLKWIHRSFPKNCKMSYLPKEYQPCLLHAGLDLSME